MTMSPSTILMCEPDHYGVHYSINPWMSLQTPVSRKTSWKQWNRLRQLILDCGARIDYVPQQPGLPDMVFTANGGLIYDGKCVLSRFRHEQRQAEEVFFDLHFRNRFEVVRLPHGLRFEGAGDALFDGETLFAGYGFRSDRHAYEMIAEVLGIGSTVYCELVNPHFYHLDTCFCPLGGAAALYYPRAFSRASQQEIEGRLDVLVVPDDEAHRFACNAVVLGRNVLLPQGCPATEKLLAQRGFVPRTCEMSEFIKAGGACKCLTLALDTAGPPKPSEDVPLLAFQASSDEMDGEGASRV